MLKNKVFWAVLIVSVLVISIGFVSIRQYRANQSKMYHECVQDWADSGATQEEARLACDDFLE